MGWVGMGWGEVGWGRGMQGMVRVRWVRVGVVGWVGYGREG